MKQSPEHEVRFTLSCNERGAVIGMSTYGKPGTGIGCITITGNLNGSTQAIQERLADIATGAYRKRKPPVAPVSISEVSQKPLIETLNSGRIPFAQVWDHIVTRDPSRAATLPPRDIE